MESHRVREECDCQPCRDFKAVAMELAEAVRKIRVLERKVAELMGKAAE